MDNLKNYFENANKSLQKVDELKKTINVLKGKLTTFSNKKEELETKKNELIAKTIYEKKTDIEKSYSEVLLEAEKRLQVAKNEKEKEKKKNIEMLVENKTKNIKENNQYLKNEIKRLLKDNKMPCFVNTTAYFTLFSPYTFLQFVGGLFTMLLIIAMPSIICFFIMKNKMMEIFPNEIIRTIMVILFYSVWILIFGSLWLFIEKISKKNAEALKDIKELRKNIKDNDKEVEVITNQVAKEIKDEDFDYTKLDREIESISIEVDGIKTKKEEALNNFNEQVVKEITTKINDDAKKDIDEVEKEIEKIKEELNSSQVEYDKLRIDISEYNTYIGKANMKESTLKKMMEIAENDESLDIDAIIKMIK